jgi:hypothetical protein
VNWVLTRNSLFLGPDADALSMVLDPGERVCRPRRVGLQTQASEFADPRRAGLALAPWHDNLNARCLQPGAQPTPCSIWNSLWQGMTTPISVVRNLGSAAPPCPTKICTDFFPQIIPLIPNASQWKDNPTLPLQSLQLYVAMKTLSLYFSSPQNHKSWWIGFLLTLFHFIVQWDLMNITFLI